MNYKSIIAQDKYWILPSIVEWDGEGYPPTETVWCCFLENVDELAAYETLFAALNTEPQ